MSTDERFRWKLIPKNPYGDVWIGLAWMNGRLMTLRALSPEARMIRRYETLQKDWASD